MTSLGGIHRAGGQLFPRHRLSPALNWRVRLNKTGLTQFPDQGQPIRPPCRLHRPFGPSNCEPTRCIQVPSLAKQPAGLQPAVLTGPGTTTGGERAEGAGGRGTGMCVFHAIPDTVPP